LEYSKFHLLLHRQTIDIKMQQFRSKKDFSGSILWMGLILLLTACNSLFMDEQKPNTPQNNFDLLWQIIDERYCYFEEKGVNWNQMRQKYWRELQKSGNDTDQTHRLELQSSGDVPDPLSAQLFYTMATMLEELRDGHVTLDDGYTSCTYTGWHTPYPDNFIPTRINTYKNNRTRYLNNETFFSTLPENIGYIRCSSFSDKFNRDEFDKALAKFEGLKGVIIDVRSNGGGLVSEAYMFASRFAREKIHVGYVRYKIGKGHKDFSDYFARYVEPDGANPFHGKVVVITNRKVYSAANLFVSFMSCFPQVCIMGDNTGGGGGVPISAELYNGWTVKLSTNPVFDINKRSIESGIAPDYSVELNTKETQKDNIIETAKTWILAK